MDPHLSTLAQYILLTLSTTHQQCPYCRYAWWEGPIRPAKVMVKVHSSARLIVLCTSNSANSVQQIAHHGSSLLSESNCPTAQLPNHKSHHGPKFLSTNRQSQCVHGNLQLSSPTPSKCLRSTSASMTCFSPRFAELWVRHEPPLPCPIFFW